MQSATWKILAGLALLGILAAGSGAAYLHFRQSTEEAFIPCGGERDGGNALPPLPPMAPVTRTGAVTGNSLVAELRTRTVPLARC